MTRETLVVTNIARSGFLMFWHRGCLLRWEADRNRTGKELLNIVSVLMHWKLSEFSQRSLGLFPHHPWVFSVGEKFVREVFQRFGIQWSMTVLALGVHSSYLLLFVVISFGLRRTVFLWLFNLVFGGLASKFHVVELSHNHYHFSITCKAMGFFVYALRRFTSDF